ncbi:MAG: hypothetical protein OFPI_37360 [Osedax symbiont Rs2]|nr:MAG: hypothetical protein OFPI_37360 [Osedax symbiont Rs2]
MLLAQLLMIFLHSIACWLVFGCSPRLQIECKSGLNSDKGQ